MSKINMTPEIGHSLKELRLKHNTKSISLAEYIKKSPAYISKLEKGEIKQIEKSDLKKIVNFITNDDQGYEEFVESYIKEFNIDESDDSFLWLTNFDLIERKIPIEKSLVDYIKDFLNSLEITTQDLIIYINKNSDLDDNFFLKYNINRSEIKTNHWYNYIDNVDGESVTKSFIVLNYPFNILEPILSREEVSCSHTLIYATVYHLLKLQNKETTLTSNELHNKTSEILYAHKFYSLFELLKLESQSQTLTEYKNLLSEFDRDNLNLINEILDAIKFLSIYDVKYTNEILEGIVDNLSPDLSFALNYMAISLKPLCDASANIKREFLEQVREQVRIFANKPEPEKKIERY